MVFYTYYAYFIYKGDHSSRIFGYVTGLGAHVRQSLMGHSFVPIFELLYDNVPEFKTIFVIFNFIQNVIAKYYYKIF